MREVVKRLFENNHRNGSSQADKDYLNYLNKHIDGVQKVYYRVLLPILTQEVDNSILDLMPSILEAHDASKFSDLEFPAYRDYFYDKKNNPRSSEAFCIAWNHHQKRNPHHWQYWCLVNDVDNPQVQPLDMPLPYIIEMLCDWSSAGAHYGNTANEWFEKQRDRFIMTPNTISIVSKYVKYI